MGKVVVITGAGLGLGRALARRLVADGDSVVLLGRTFAKVQAVAEALGENALALHCDVADPDSVRAAFDAIAERHRAIDVLINNAAVFHPFLIEEASDAQLRSTIDINLLGPVLCVRSAIPLLRRSRAGLIISISSESVEIDLPHLVLYETTKVALERLARGLRQELRADGIRSTVLRIGALIDRDKEWDVDPVAFGRFAEAAAAAGMPLIGDHASELSTIAGIIRMMIDLPRDTSIDLVTTSGHGSL